MILLDGTTNISTSTLKTGKGKGGDTCSCKRSIHYFPPLFLSSQKRLFLINECPSKRLGPFRRAEKNNIEFSP